MVSKIQKRRRRILLIILLIISLSALLSSVSQTFYKTTAGRVIMSVCQPLVKGAGYVRRLGERLTTAWFGSERLAEDNERLKHDLVAARLQLNETRNALTTLERTQHLVSSPAGHTIARYSLLPANIIGYSSNPWTRTILVNRGAKDGVRPEQTVVNEKGVVGVVKEASGDMALVHLLIDIQSALMVRVSETGELGIVEGTGKPDILNLRTEGLSRRLRRNDHVVTAGLQQSLFPGDLPVGEVEGIEKDKYGRSKVYVRPTADFMRLDFLLILLGSESMKEKRLEGD